MTASSCGASPSSSHGGQRLYLHKNGSVSSNHTAHLISHAARLSPPRLAAAGPVPAGDFLSDKIPPRALLFPPSNRHTRTAPPAGQFVAHVRPPSRAAPSRGGRSSPAAGPTDREQGKAHRPRSGLRIHLFPLLPDRHAWGWGACQLGRVERRRALLLGRAAPAGGSGHWQASVAATGSSKGGAGGAGSRQAAGGRRAGGGQAAWCEEHEAQVPRARGARGARRGKRGVSLVPSLLEELHRERFHVARLLEQHGLRGKARQTRMGWAWGGMGSGATRAAPQRRSEPAAPGPAVGCSARPFLFRENKGSCDAAPHLHERVDQPPKLWLGAEVPLVVHLDRDLVRRVGGGRHLYQSSAAQVTASEIEESASID